MKKTAQLFCKSNFLSGFANLKSSVARTKAELTFSIQANLHSAPQKIDDRLSYPKSLSSIQFFLHVFTLIQIESVSRITSSEPDFLLANPQLTISPGHSTLIFPTAAGKLTTERPGPRFRRQFLPISRKWPELEAAVAGRVGAFLPAKPYFFAGPRQHAPVFPRRSPPMLAPSFLRSLISSPGHANMLRFFLYSRRPCWRLPSC